MPLEGERFADVLPSLIEYAGWHNLGEGSALARTPARLLAGPSAPVLLGGTAERTLVRSVSIKPVTKTYYNPDTGESRTEQGPNLVMDDRFIPLESVFTGAGAYPNPEATRILRADFRFLWSRERVLRGEFALAGRVRIGPFTACFPLEESTSAVPLDQVPRIGAN